jgi:uncharacterized cupin superfamily protein
VSRLSIYGDEPWDRVAEQMRIKTRFFGGALGAKELGASLHELLPGSTGFNLHAHYGMEELFVVLSGRPTLRTGSGEEELAAGDVVSMPRGMEGLHTFTNPTDERARVLAISTLPVPEVVVYPEIGKVGVATRDPFAVPPENGDQGIVAMFDLPQPDENPI